MSPHLPVLDETAIRVLTDLLSNDAEVLPLAFDGGNYSLINVTKVLDCVDYGNSVYKTFRDGKRIMRFERIAFLEDKLVGVNIFRIKDLPLNRPFVSDAFRNAVIENNLSGFRFELAWDGDKNLQSV